MVSFFSDEEQLVYNPEDNTFHIINTNEKRICSYKEKLEDILLIYQEKIYTNYEYFDSDINMINKFIEIEELLYLGSL